MSERGTPQAASETAASDARRRRWRRFGALASGVLFAVAILLLVHILRDLDMAKVAAALSVTGSRQLLLALALTCCSYLLLTGYDALALRQIGARISYATTALASFASYAVSFTLGFPLFTAATVRFWIYSPAGLSGAGIANLTIIAGITFWLGMGLVLALGLIGQAGALAEVNHLPGAANRLIGLALLVVVLLYLVWVSLKPRAVVVQKWRLLLPSFKVSLGQIILGALDVCCAGGVLYMLLPHGHGIVFSSFIAVYVFACLLGIASHAPGGLGVFEATLLVAWPTQSREGLLSALLLYRLFYYLLPFVFALALLGLREVIRHARLFRAHSDAPVQETVQPVAEPDQVSQP